MPDFQPPPTYAEVILLDERTNKGKFNPIWLKWFLDLVTTLNNGGGAVLNHNALDGLQGGNATERYHLTQAEHTATATIPYTVPVGGTGAVSFSQYAILIGDDVDPIIASLVTIDPVTGSILAVDGDEANPAYSFASAPGDGLHVQAPGSYDMNVATQFRIHVGGGLTIYDFQATILNFAPDNTMDIGADGANRPKNIYVAGFVNTTTIELGHISDTTLARSGAGDVTIEGNVIYRAGGTDVTVLDGGTGASDAPTACANLGALQIANIDDVPVNGELSAPISSNWAFDHEAAADPHPGYLTTAEGDAAYADIASEVPAGGTTGQVLKKQSNTDYDFAWDTDDTGATAGVVPIGGIVMWSGTVASIPTDWALCDGTANSPGPDLRDKFIVGAKQDDAGVAKTNLTGSLTQSGAAAASAHGLTTNVGISGHSLTTDVALSAHSLDTNVAVSAHSLSTNVAIDAHALSTNVAVSAHTLSTNVALSAHSLTTNVAIGNHTLTGAAGRTSTASTRSFVTTTGAVTHAITQPVVGTHAITQPVVQTHAVTQPVVQAHSITQPVVQTHAVTQPVVGSHAITQPVVGTHAVTQPVVGDHTSLWPVYYALAFIQRMA